MSLTSHLQDAHSPFRRFMQEHFPHTHSITEVCKGRLASTTTIRPAAVVPYATLGQAIDYRMRYYFAVTPSNRLVAWLGAIKLADGPLVDRAPEGKVQILVGEMDELTLSTDIIRGFFQSLDKVLRRTNPVGHRLEYDDETNLLRHCVVLGLFEEVFRAGPRVGSPLFSPQAKKTLHALLAVAEPHWLDDLCAMSWAFYHTFDDHLLSSAVLNPTFAGSRDVGGADADLILDGCLVDVKATINPRVDPLWLYQLLGYVLLDYPDEYRLRTVGIYLARQQILLQWPLDEIIATLAGASALPLARYREQFQCMTDIRASGQRTTALLPLR